MPDSCELKRYATDDPVTVRAPLTTGVDGRTRVRESAALAEAASKAARRRQAFSERRVMAAPYTVKFTT
jgi:hypothetical protein